MSPDEFRRASYAEFARWQQAEGCTSGAGAGARALMAAVLLTDPRNLRSWGIFNCRNTVLGSRSAHGEGRALDVGCTVSQGRRLVDLLLNIRWKDERGKMHQGPRGLGISAIIHDRKIYSAKSPNGRPYYGHPHRDHVHIEMTRKAARRLSLGRAKRLLT